MSPGGERKGRRLARRVLTELLRSLAPLSCLNLLVIPPDLLAGEDDAGASPAGGPPPGHPEWAAGRRPLTEAEQELWAHLEGLDWQ
jgi:hypothetical protein